MSNTGPASAVTSLQTQENVPQQDGHQCGSSSSSLVGFWGAVPVAQQAGYGQITDSSGGTAAATNGIQTITGTYNSTILANAIATLAAQINSYAAALKTAGITTN